MDEIDECFLSLLYNGNSEASYVSGCGFFYENYYDAIVRDMESELYSRLSDLNNLDNEDLDDDLYDYITEIEKEWIYDILAEFNKEDVIKILKDNKFYRQKAGLMGMNGMIKMKIKPVSRSVTINNYKRFEPLYKCYCPKCNKMLKRNEEVCICGQEIDWSEWQ